ncbi:twin-arginine translocase TatA/TatE family subunit [Nibricoccus aquaticus]|uniref:Sec-independent protein translocase protein TatA n=2 Tax=Nibricoccus aquaticus TaxID=2576891 RepID=A0A290QD34_9BACT|nr:twin-arginine translocase TatA/TatE family subunit [Nibricoccus aquaticus]
MGMGSTELIVLLLIVLLLFGGAKLPSLARGLGQSIKEFKKASKGEDEEPAAQSTATETSKKAETTKTHGAN